MSRCDIEGIVTEAKHGSVKVETVPAAACAGCAGKMLCGSGRVLSVQTSAGIYMPGEKVSLSIPHSSGLLISAILYGGGTVLGIILAALAYLVLHTTEVTSAVIFIITELVWLPLAALRLRGYARRNTEIRKVSGI